MPLLETFQQRQNSFGQQAARWQQQYNQLSWVRVLVFVAGIAGIWLLYRNDTAALLVIGFAVLVLGLFLYLMKKHNQIAYQRDQCRFMSQINQEETARLKGKHHPEENGNQHADAKHPYLTDLDIFGRSSLFELLNRSTTLGGNLLLASWLKQAASAQEIHQRQQTIKEMAPYIDWRQHFQASGMHVKASLPEIESLLQWIDEPPVLSPKKWLVGLVYILPVLTVTAILLSVFTEITYHLPAFFILINSALLGYTFKEVKDASEKTAKSAKVLKVYAELLHTLETCPFQSERMQELKRALEHSHSKASTRIRQLSSLLYNLEARQNVYFYALVSSTILWDLFFVMRLEKWKEQVQEDIHLWLQSVSEAETLNSLAGFMYANPEYCLPEISSENLHLQAQYMAHPLILKEKRISNSIHLSGAGKTMVITGSNMSGKSTFLRTVGINAVLAMAGAPVCAAGFTVSIFQVFTSMRTQDSLEENVSSFYAELKRLKQLIDSLPEGKPILYLLDEILKGTNSQDRHSGAQALIRQLHRYNASGFISTHDLALGDMSKEIPGFVSNYSFNSEVVNDKLYFDYTLREGVCKSFNASKLMQQIGIEME
ncbi:DNA mismatch repair protein MutS [Rhodocytophaga rosea]|uniref:DNA mismatch repair protein MutS n=1 Tax=Rhodocytophaga rosea TaxID=2704465 RepID=A0A6C0GCQ6_9BACT|nr:DNA mismatch repair protein MutS [Rhodocytophaga rosea]QHT65612.1 DNA mismatch repair protein MutS [Rhodocytophaga rosea]